MSLTKKISKNKLPCFFFNGWCIGFGTGDATPTMFIKTPTSNYIVLILKLTIIVAPKICLVLCQSGTWLSVFPCI